jgi:hypothetical protein
MSAELELKAKLLLDRFDWARVSHGPESVEANKALLALVRFSEKCGIRLK